MIFSFFIFHSPILLLKIIMIFYETIFNAFNAQKINYIVVGGVAFNLLGGSRSTFDLDILLEMNDENIQKTILTLTKLGYQPKQPVNPLDFAKKEVRDNWIYEKNMKAFNFFKNERSLEEVDIIIDSPIDYDNAIKDAETIKFNQFTIPIISLNNLILMKQVSSRIKDKLDVEELEIMKNQNNER